MTCIVGVVAGREVTIGADSAGVAGSEQTIRRDRKVFRNGEFVIGFTSSFRMGQLLRHAFTPPPLPKRAADLERYMVLDFVDALRALLKERGWAKTDSGREEGGCFLVGVRGRLFAIYSDYQVEEASDGFNSVGCGSAVARGALFATGAMKPKPRLLVALRAAERCASGVRGPFHLATASPP